MRKLPITAIILTKDEELNLPHCLKSIAAHAEHILVVDSGSADRTAAIAKEFGAEVIEHPFTTQAEQFNWALDNIPVRSEWILRLDADEVMSEELWQDIEQALPAAPPDLAGFYLRRRMYFLGRWIKHGAYYPTILLRLFRQGRARSEYRAMDEHIVLTGGRAETLPHDFKDENHKKLSWWIQKHNEYASREARSVAAGQDKTSLAADLWGSQAERKRWIKVHAYSRLPLFLGPFLYFLYRYFIRLGFLDGPEGFIFHFMQGFWYRMLIDAKIYELRKNKKT